MAGYQPYGYAAPAPMAPRRKGYLAFGITYMSLRGLMLLLFLILMLVAASFIMSMTSSSGSGGPSGAAKSDLEAGLAIVVVILLVWLAYTVAAGIMAIKGMIAGVYMGLVDAGLTALLGIFGLFTEEPAGGLCWLMPSIAIITLGIFALKQRYGAPAPAYGVPYPQAGAYGHRNVIPQHGQPGGVNRMANWNPQFAPPGHAPQPAALPQAPATQTGGTSAVVPSPKMAALSILSLAASVDPDMSQDALERARAVAAKLLGPAAQSRAQRQLAQPVTVMDVETDLMPHTGILNQQANPIMKDSVVKAASYVLKGPNGVEGLGEQFIATLKQQLGV